MPWPAAFQDAHPDIEVRIATATRLVEFRREEVDLAIRYGKGRWPGLRADWLMSEEMLPVYSPERPDAERPLRQPEDLARLNLLGVNLYPEEWLSWLTGAGLPTSVATGPGLTYDLDLMALQAAIDGLDVALGRTPFVEADIATGRLVAPFDIVPPSEAGFYVVAPLHTVYRRGVRRSRGFRDWMIATAASDRC